MAMKATRIHERRQATLMAMALQSTMVPLGTPMPDVTLPDLDGNPVHTRRSVGDRATLVMFTCNHCPYVRHLEQAIGELTRVFEGPTLDVIAISSNDVEQYPDDDAAGLRSQQQRATWQFDYLIDADQVAATQFNAACTPDFFLYDQQGLLTYRGAFDGSTPKNGVPIDGQMLRTAIEQTIAGQPVPEPHKPSMGCGIKWKPGNDPN